MSYIRNQVEYIEEVSKSLITAEGAEKVFKAHLHAHMVEKCNHSSSCNLDAQR